MANIRVTCPICGQMLEVGAEHDGREVECGACFQVFVAEGPRGRIKGAPRSHARRDDDHDPRRDEYDDGPRRGGAGGNVGASGTAVAGVIVGVFALVTSCCPFTGIAFGIVAMVLGTIGMKYPNSSGAGASAVVLGAIAFLISASLVVFWFVGGANQFGN